MGDIKRKRKKYTTPKMLFDSERITSENKIIKEFGLKNKKEVWKAKSEISKIRRRAKMLIAKGKEDQKEFFEKLNRLGFKVVDISDVLALTEEDWLGRRLQTFIYKKGFANTPKQARQLIVHKKVLVDENIVNIPSFTVTVDLENKLKIKENKQVQTVEVEDGKKE